MVRVAGWPGRGAGRRASRGQFEGALVHDARHRNGQPRAADRRASRSGSPRSCASRARAGPVSSSRRCIATSRSSPSRFSACTSRPRSPTASPRSGSSTCSFRSSVRTGRSGSGLGTVAFDLLLALVVTSLLRERIGYRVWRAVHWAAYAAWPIALVHGLGTGKRHPGPLGRARQRRVPRDRAHRGAVPGRLDANRVGSAAGRRGAGEPGDRGRERRLDAGRADAARLGAQGRHSERAARVARAVGAAPAPGGPQRRRIPIPFTSATRGSLRRSTDAAGLATVTIDTRLPAAHDARLRVVIAGTALSGGGVSMQRSSVQLGVAGAPNLYRGAVVSARRHVGPGDRARARAVPAPCSSMDLLDRRRERRHRDGLRPQRCGRTMTTGTPIDMQASARDARRHRSRGCCRRRRSARSSSTCSGSATCRPRAPSCSARSSGAGFAARAVPASRPRRSSPPSPRAGGRSSSRTAPRVSRRARRTSC